MKLPSVLLRISANLKKPLFFIVAFSPLLAYAQPPNDNCAGAIPFPTLTYGGGCASVTVNTATATQSGGGGCGGTPDDDVWYTFIVPPGCTTISYTTTNVSGSSDRDFQFFTGTCGSLTTIHCTQFQIGQVSGLTPGATYYIRTFTTGAGDSSNFTLCLRPVGQGTWTWLSGTNTINDIGVYGTQGVPSSNNHPPNCYEAVEWKDKQGNFWIYGGTYPFNSDLWKYNPITNEWTWVKGNKLENQPPVYGTKGVANLANTPGVRCYCAATWIDKLGTLWLFGGQDKDFNRRSDLWKYDITTNEWTWVQGDNIANSPGDRGIKGIPTISNNPAARSETCSAWIDASNNLWLFGGSGEDDNASFGQLNDVWKYDIGTNEWTWMKGSAYVNAAANYGTKGIADTMNDPGAGQTYAKWKDLSGNFWLMGGLLFDSLSSNYYVTNDVWMYDLNSYEWTWMWGTNLQNDYGEYNIKCLFDTINWPSSRCEQRSAVTDNYGRFWLFGGFTNIANGWTYNDLWVFDSQQLKWSWMSGVNLGNQAGNYGTKGVGSPSNMPPSRGGAIAWWGNDNKFYLFGGMQNKNTFSDVWVYNPDTGCISNLVLPPPLADLQSDKTSICENECVTLTDLSTNATSWQWSFAGGLPATSSVENPQSVCYIAAGTYNVTLIASNAAGSDTVKFNNYINVKSAPPTPVIIQRQDTLYCTTDTSYASYQWYLDSTLIDGATDSLLVVSKNGNYNLRITNKSGCQIAVGITIITGIQNYMNDNMISLSPNPAADQLSVNGNWKEGTNMKLTIINVLGQTIYTEELNRKQATLNCKPFPSGIYFVQVADESGRWVGRFVKE